MVVNNKQTKLMLDDSTPAQEILDMCKEKLHKLMHYDGDDMANQFERMFHERAPYLIDEIFDEIGNPLQALKEVSHLVD